MLLLLSNFKVFEAEYAALFDKGEEFGVALADLHQHQVPRLGISQVEQVGGVYKGRDAQPEYT